jgi:hypothetical protein
MQLEQITLKLAAAEARAAGGLRLEPGAALVARVVTAPPGGGRGLLSLAGHLLEVRMPPGLEPGRTLPLRVERADAQALVLRIRPEPAHDAAAGQRLAGDLALRGDGDMLRAAMALSGGVVWLPGGPAAELAVQPDAGEQARAAGPAGEAAFVLHDPALGAIEVRLQMTGGAVRAQVTTAPGPLTERAEAGLPELVAALGRATGRPATAGVAPRPESAAPPTPPAGAVDVHA